MLLGTCFVNSYMVMKGTGFAIGFGFFGDPVIQPALELMNRCVLFAIPNLQYRL